MDEDERTSFVERRKELEIGLTDILTKLDRVDDLKRRLTAKEYEIRNELQDIDDILYRD